jgi:hypothetical protein
MIERWLAAVRDHPDRPAALQRHVLTMLALRLDWTTGSGFASVRDIAADADASDHTVKRATGWARSDKVGLLMRTRRGHRLGNGGAVASEWRLTLPADDQSLGATRGTLTSQGANGAGLKVPTGASQSANGATHQESSTSQSSSSGRPSAAETIRAAVPRATDDEIETYLAKIVKDHVPVNLESYIARFSAAKIASGITAIRSERDRQARAVAAAAIEAARRDGPHCEEHGTPGGAFLHPVTRKPLCPDCRSAQRVAS